MSDLQSSPMHADCVFAVVCVHAMRPCLLPCVLLLCVLLLCAGNAQTHDALQHVTDSAEKRFSAVHGFSEQQLEPCILAHKLSTYVQAELAVQRCVCVRLLACHLY